jgi:hypothetical protein
MKPLELALKYIEIFYSGKNLEKLTDLLAEDLSFTGPYYTFNSAEDYINSLKKDPPWGMSFKIIKSLQDENSACLIYIFQKGNISTAMAQLFEVADEKITKINLIFDTKAFIK